MPLVGTNHNSPVILLNLNMLKQLRLRNFTVFQEADLVFSPGLNVIIGENGTGKTHLLKLAYALSNAWHHLVKNHGLISDQKIERYFSDRLLQIFKPDKLGSLTTTGSDGKSSVLGTFIGSIPTLSFRMADEPEMSPLPDDTTWQFSFSNRSIDHVDVQERLCSNAVYGKGVYLPSKEMVSFFEGFLALYEKHETQFDETYRDLALHLSTPKLKKAPAIVNKRTLLGNLSKATGGTLIMESGKFYLLSGSKRKEITLIAEGARKLATLLHLLENGSLETGDTLFWDEPETNLNPKLIKEVAAAILFLCKNGIQVVIATHSLFLLRELEILTQQKVYKGVPQRYFALKKCDSHVEVHQGDTLYDLDPLVLLDEDLEQSGRFLAMDEAQ